MASVKKYAWEIFAAGGVGIFFFFTRVTTLLSLPLFTDEAIYIRWAQIAAQDANWRFISLTDGKQPLFIWLTVLAMKFFTHPLFAGRSVSVFAGAGTMVGLFFVSYILFKKRWIGIISAFLYAIYPFALVYDRMALYDSLVGMFAVWGLYFVILLIKQPTLGNAFLLGITAGLGVLNKTNGFFTIYLLPFAYILFDYKSQKKRNRFIHLFFLSGIAIITTVAIYSILRLSPFFYIIAQKNAIFVYPLHEWIKHPFAYFFGNFWLGERDWFLSYFGIVFLLLAFASFIVKREQVKEKLVLFLWFFLPFVALGLFGNTIYPRYIFFMTLSLLPLVAYTLFIFSTVIKKTEYYSVIFLLCIFPSLFATFKVLTDFAHAPIPLSDRNQYNNDWPSGYGFNESLAFLLSLPDKKVALFTEGTFGLMPYAYEIYLHENSKFVIKGVWPIDEKVKAELLLSAEKMPTYMVFYQPCSGCLEKGLAPKDWPLKKVFEVQKPAKDAYLRIYRVETGEPYANN